MRWRWWRCPTVTTIRTAKSTLESALLTNDGPTLRLAVAEPEILAHQLPRLVNTVHPPVLSPDRPHPQAARRRPLNRVLLRVVVPLPQASSVPPEVQSLTAQCDHTHPGRFVTHVEATCNDAVNAVNRDAIAAHNFIDKVGGGVVTVDVAGQDGSRRCVQPMSVRRRSGDREAHRRDDGNLQQRAHPAPSRHGEATVRRATEYVNPAMQAASIRIHAVRSPERRFGPGRRHPCSQPAARSGRCRRDDRLRECGSIPIAVRRSRGLRTPAVHARIDRGAARRHSPGFRRANRRGLPPPSELVV